MKRSLSVFGILGLAFVLLSSFLICEKPQDPPRDKKAQKHIKMVKIGDDGKKTILDTIIDGENIFVWNGDTLGFEDELKWVTKENFKMDSILKNFDFNFEFEMDQDDEGNLTIRKRGKEGNRMLIHPPGFPDTPRPPRPMGMMIMKNRNHSNIIDLSDPGIIKYDKKMRKDGTEKITIIRERTNENDTELNEEIIIHGTPDGKEFFHGRKPEKKIIIKKQKKGDKEQIEVEIEKGEQSN